MLYLRVGVVAVALALLGVVYAQDKDKDKTAKDDKAPAVKLRGQLPTYFKKLGLRDDQVQKVYRVRATYKTKIDELKAKIDKLRAEEKEDLEKILTPEQVKRLKELRSGAK
jgi:hypothetical protein